MSVRRVKDKSGTALLEVMVAVVILTVSLLMLLNMAMVALDGNDWSNKTTASIQLLQEKLEQLRTSETFDSGSDTVGSAVRSWSVSDAADYLRKIDVTIEWEDAKGTPHLNTMTALVRSDSI